ncbi:MAG: DNA mismatch repair protein MutS [Bacteroidales bacterium]|nr:DNA mismatch repair protein MutS [Bacteroidales bacterium]
MLFKNVISENSSMHYVYDQLQVTSGLGRSCLLNMPFVTDVEALSQELDLVQTMLGLLHREGTQDFFRNIHEQLCQLNDIRPTVALMNGDTVFDDIQLFEIKKTAIIARQVSGLLRGISCDVFPMEEMSELIDILDPEHTGIPHFYVYSAYSEKLKALRDQMRSAEDADERERLRFQAEGEEDAVRADLTRQVGRFQEALSHNLDTLAHLDVIVAKAMLALQWSACHPTVTDSMDFRQLRNPQVDEVLREQGKQFQPIDIAFGRETILVTGANMAGKSVLLKTLSMAQYLLQFGFFIPAERAEMMVVDEVICSMGDSQSELSGLSSFAVEILTIDRIIKTAKRGVRVLALVDELARTTNPEEGKRLVSAFVRMAQQLSITAIVTTHYSGIHADCRRLRVRGLQLEGQPAVTARNIGNYMDYSLVETTDDEVPKEALTIAELLEVDADFLQMARER